MNMDNEIQPHYEPLVPNPDSPFDAWNPPKEVRRWMRLAYKHLNKICDMYTDKEKQIRYRTECPLNWGEKCCHHAIRFWV